MSSIATFDTLEDPPTHKGAIDRSNFANEYCVGLGDYFKVSHAYKRDFESQLDGDFKGKGRALEKLPHLANKVRIGRLPYSHCVYLSPYPVGII